MCNAGPSRPNPSLYRYFMIITTNQQQQYISQRLQSRAMVPQSPTSSSLGPFDVPLLAPTRSRPKKSSNQSGLDKIDYPYRVACTQEVPAKTVLAIYRNGKGGIRLPGHFAWRERKSTLALSRLLYFFRTSLRHCNHTDSQHAHTTAHRHTLHVHNAEPPSTLPGPPPTFSRLIANPQKPAFGERCRIELRSNHRPPSSPTAQPS